MKSKPATFYGVYSPQDHSPTSQKGPELVFRTWSTAKPHVHGVPGAKSKKFTTLAEALLFSQTGQVPCYLPTNVIIAVDLDVLAIHVAIVSQTSPEHPIFTRLPDSLLPENDASENHNIPNLDAMLLAGLMEAFNQLIRKEKTGQRYWSKINVHFAPPYEKTTWSTLGQRMKSGKTRQTRLWYSIVKRQVANMDSVVDWSPALKPTGYMDILKRLTTK